MKNYVVFLLLCIFLWQCSGDREDRCAFKPDVTNVHVNLDLEQLQDSLVNVSSKKRLVTFLGSHPLIRDYVFRRGEYSNDSAFVNELYLRFTNPHIDTLLQETKRVFGNLDGLKNEFHEAFTNLKYYYPDFRVPKIQTVVSGLDTDMLVSDSLIIISLDFYLGKGAKYRPKMYDYLLRRYEPEDIVPSCLMLYGIGASLNKTDLNDKTVMAEMIAYGKSFYFAKHMLPCTPDSVFLWYTSDEIKGARENEDLIWARLLEDKILFSTNMIDKRNYLGERPFTIQVGEKCPGRIAQWVGWRIVDKYMSTHRDISLQQLMEMSDAQKLFRDSGYKPISK
jgi:gliding motility-associated lipoprotein GldB